MRAIYLDEDGYLIGDGKGSAEIGPSSTFLGESFLGMLSKLRVGFQMQAVTEIVVLLAAGALTLLGLPTDREFYSRRDTDEESPHDELIGKLREAGWTITKLGTWFTVHRKSFVVHVGVLPAIRRQDYPMWSEVPAEMVAAHELWYRLTGAAYHGVGGVSGNALLKSMVDPKRQPKWQVEPIVGDPTEKPFVLTDWRGDEMPDAEYAHGADLRRAYLNSMGTMEVSRDELRKQHMKTFDPKLAGWWYVEMAPWTHGAIMPDPAGYSRTIAGRDGLRFGWRTTQTLKLLTRLSDEGVYGGFWVTGDCYLGQGSRVTRSWAHKLDTAWLTAPDQTDYPEAAALVRKAVKATYTGAAGMWRSKRSLIRRPDWTAAAIAESRSNAWWKVWTIGKATGRWPVGVDVDNWWYPSSSAEWSVPPGWEVGDHLGEIKAGGTVVQADVVAP